MNVTITSTDSNETMRIINSLNMACAIFEIQINLKKRLLHKCEHFIFDSNEDVIEWVFEHINEELQGINIEDLIE
jgi:hypothetical protein